MLNIRLKTPEELELMRHGGKITSQAIREVVTALRPGITTLELDKIAEDVIYHHKATPSFKGYEGFEYATCINVNQGVVHGVPSNYALKEGDLVSVDIGTFYKGFHTDAARTVRVREEAVRSRICPWQIRDLTNLTTTFIDAGNKALEVATAQCRPGNRIGDISSAIQQTVESYGYNVIHDYVGHGIGRELHEDPEIPCFGVSGTGLSLEVGMVLALEVMWMKGSGETVIAKDNWTVETQDGQISGLMEDTVAVTENGPLRLTF